MTISYSSGDRPFQFPKTETYNPGEKKFYSASYRPKTWTPDAVYLAGVDVVIPETPSGFYHECTGSGVSQSTEPAFATEKAGTTEDNTVQWLAKPYDLMLRAGDNVSLSSWAGENAEQVDSQEIIDGSQTRFRLISVPVGATTATLINSITVTRKNGDQEDFQRTFIIPVKPTT